MFRNPVREFPLSSGRPSRPRCEQLEERLVLDGSHAAAPTADPGAYATVLGLTGVVAALNAQVAGRVLAADRGVDLGAAGRVNRLVGNVGRVIAALQQAEMQAVQSQASVNDPNFQFADVLFRSAVDDFKTVQRVADGLEVDIALNIATAARAAAGTARQVKNVINAGTALQGEAQSLFNQFVGRGR